MYSVDKKSYFSLMIWFLTSSHVVPRSRFELCCLSLSPFKYAPSNDVICDDVIGDIIYDDVIGDVICDDVIRKPWNGVNLARCC